MSIQTKFFVYLFVLVILPLMAASFLILAISSDIIGSKSREAVFQSFKQTEFRLNQIVSNTEYLSDKLLGNEDVQQLSNLNEQSYPYEFVVRTNGLNYFLQQEIRVQPYLHSFLLINNTKPIYRFGYYENEVNQELLQQAIQQKGVPVWTGTYKLRSYQNPSENEYVVSLFRAVNDLNSFVVISVEILTIPEQALEQAYTENDAWQNDGMVIIDGNGLIVSSKNKSEIGNHIGQLSYVQQVMSGIEGNFRSTINGEKVSVFYYKLPNPGWHVIKVVPDSQINEPQKFLRILIVVALSICLLFGIIFSVIQNNRIIRPIKLLKREMDKVKRGNLEIKLDVQQKDEIGQLVFHFRAMGLELKDLIDKVYHSQLKEKEARLQMLSMQINPHFLYNTLESIRWVAIRHQVDSVADQLEVLSNMFRYSLTQEHQITTIEQEVEHVRNYMIILNFRFNHIYEFEVQVEEHMLQYECPHFILQPLVENSIKHGFADRIEQGFIRISIVQEAAFTRICVEDNGIGADENRIRRLLDGEESHSGYALKNIHSRLQLKYGPEFGILFSSELGIGTKVVLVLPAVLRHDGV